MPSDHRVTVHEVTHNDGQYSPRDAEALNKEKVTTGAALRVAAAAVLGLVSLLILFRAPVYPLWKAEIAATEWSYYLAIAGVVVLLLTVWKRGRFSRLTGVFSVLVICIASTPVLRGVRIARRLPSRLDAAFPPALALPSASPAGRPRPLRLKTLFARAGARDVHIEAVNYASRRSGSLQLDLYRSRVPGVEQPIVIVVHGGSWHGGNRKDLPELNYYLASQGYLVAAISYRFAPEFPDPAATEDLEAAIEYLKVNAARLGGDSTRIALVGRSAGAHLVLLSAYRKRDAAIRGVVAFYPPTDQFYGYAHPSTLIPSRQILEDYIGGTPQSNTRAYARNSPIGFVGPDSPPTLLIHGSRDELVAVEQSRMLDGRLSVAHRPHLLLELPWATHGCDYVFNGPCGQLSTYAIARFLDRVLH